MVCSYLQWNLPPPHRSPHPPLQHHCHLSSAVAAGLNHLEQHVHLVRDTISKLIYMEVRNINMFSMCCNSSCLGLRNFKKVPVTWASQVVGNLLVPVKC